jgi:hypothetical protein
MIGKSLIAALGLSGCAPYPTNSPNDPVFMVYQTPSCIFICTTHLATIDEEGVAGDGSTLTLGSPSTSATSSTAGGTRSYSNDED